MTRGRFLRWYVALSVLTYMASRSTEWASGQHVEVWGSGLHNDTEICAHLLQDPNPVRVCWAIPWQHDVVSFGEGNRCVAKAARNQVKWFGRWRRVSSGATLASILEITYSVLDTTLPRLTRHACVLYLLQETIIVKCDKQWTAAWEAPELGVWMWMTVYVRPSEGVLCMRMQFDRDARVLLDQCVPVVASSPASSDRTNTTHTSLHSLAFQGGVHVDVLSWMGVPVLDTLWPQRSQFWTHDVVCRQSILDSAQMLQRLVTRYVDDTWVLETNGDLQLRVPWQTAWQRVLTAAHAHGCIVVTNRTDACTIEWGTRTRRLRQTSIPLATQRV